MTILTRKFSEFTDGGDLAPNETTVGLLSGTNTQFNNPWPNLPAGTTAERPPISASIYFRLRFNTTLELYEYYVPTLFSWVSVDTSANILPLLISHAPGEGASLIGLQNQTGVTNKSVQDLANASLVAKTDNGTLVNGVFLASLATGFLSNTITTGALASRVMTGTSSQINIANGDGSGTPTWSLSSTLNIPGTFTIQSSTAVTAIINDNTMTTAAATNIPTALSVKNYVDSVFTSGVTNVSGTANRITSTGGTTPVIDISASYVGQSSITTLGTIATGVWNGTVIGGTYGGTGVNNGASTITLGGSLTTSGSFASTFTMTGITSVTFPTSGTLLTSAGAVTSITGTANQITASASTGAVTLALASNAVLPGSAGVTLPSGNTAARAGSAGTIRFNSQTSVFESTVDGAAWQTITTTGTAVTSVTGTTNRITSTGGTTPVIDISASYVGQSSITTLGTITTGVWTGTTIAVANGGTGITSFGTGVATALGQNVTGSGGIALATSPAFVTPTLGAATATSITFSPTTGGIVGTTTNNNASSGYVGEIISSSVVLASAVSLTTNVVANVTSVSLTAGDWDVWGNIYFNVTGATTVLLAWSSSSSATVPDASLYNQVSPSVGGNGWTIPYIRVSLSGSGNAYLSVKATFSSPGVSACGNIYARRAR